MASKRPRNGVLDLVYPHSGAVRRYALCAVMRVELGGVRAACGRWDDPNVLVDVTAVLTSPTLNSVGEAFSVPAHSPQSVIAPATPSAEQSAWSALTAGNDDPQLIPQADPQGSRALTVLDSLTTLSTAQLEEWASDPAAVATVLSAPPSADAVAGWWAGADVGAKLRLLAAAPEVVGSLEGMPYGARDTANRDVLADQITAITAKIASGSVGRAATEQLQAQLHMLQQVKAAIATGDSGLPRTLVSLDVSDGGRAVIAVGDLATADYVSYLVPGMFYSVDSEIGSWAGAADQLAVDQAAWLTRLTPAQHRDSTASVATVAWIGYRTPTVVTVSSLDLAEEGRDALTASLRGLDAARGEQPQPYLTVLAHSYGATAALLALQQNDVTVDALAMVGSPGSPAENVGQLRVRNGNVWVAEAALDPVASTGVFGSQPLSAAYGAHHFGVEGATDPLTGRELAGSFGHVDYFTSGSESFRNMALIGIGRGDYVLDPDGKTTAAPRALASSSVAWR